MKKIQKVMLGASIGALSLAMLGSVAADAQVLAPSTLDFKDQSFQMRNSGEGAVSFDAVKIKGKGDNATPSWNAKAKWDAYDVSGSQIVDLSSRKTTKDLVVAIKDMSDSASIVYWVPADTSKYKGKYEGGSLSITDSNKPVDSSAVKFEYRTENGYWKDYSPTETSFAMYEQQGATLYFRRKAEVVDSNGYTSVRDKLGKEEQAYVNALIKAKGPYFASKEFKVKISKKSNGPSVGIDYNWQTIKVKDTMEYRAKNYQGRWVNGSGNGDWTAVPSGVKELKMTDLFKDDGVAYSCTVEVRTKADEAKKKSASKPTILQFPEAMHLTASNFGLINKDGMVNGALPEKGLTFKLLRRKDKNYCRFINSHPENTYEIYAEDPFENKKAAKIAVVKPATASGNTEVEVKEAKVPEKSTLYVCIAADKKKNRFRSKATPCGGVGVMYYPEEDTE